MLVYRVSSQKEIDKLFQNRDIKDIGNYCTKTDVNNHEYEENSKYIHFFKEKSSIFHFLLRGKYICEYDIPNEILEKYEGVGYYHNYYGFKSMVEVVEYAVKCCELDFNYLNKVEYSKEELEPEYYLDDPNLLKFVQSVYNKEKEKKLILKK